MVVFGFLDSSEFGGGWEDSGSQKCYRRKSRGCIVGLQRASTATLAEKEQHKPREQVVDVAEASGEGGEKRIGSYWGVPNSRVMKEGMRLNGGGTALCCDLPSGYVNRFEEASCAYHFLGQIGLLD